MHDESGPGRVSYTRPGAPPTIDSEPTPARLHFSVLGDSELDPEWTGKFVPWPDSSGLTPAYVLPCTGAEGPILRFERHTYHDQVVLTSGSGSRRRCEPSSGRTSKKNFRAILLDGSKRPINRLSVQTVRATVLLRTSFHYQTRNALLSAGAL